LQALVLARSEVSGALWWAANPACLGTLLARNLIRDHEKMFVQNAADALLIILPLTGALARYGFQLSRWQASTAWFVHVMHLTSKRRRYSVELGPYCW
jgi:hypothetical protein